MNFRARGKVSLNYLHACEKESKLIVTQFSDPAPTAQAKRQCRDCLEVMIPLHSVMQFEPLT